MLNCCTTLPLFATTPLFCFRFASWYFARLAGIGSPRFRKMCRKRRVHESIFGMSWRRCSLISLLSSFLYLYFWRYGEAIYSAEKSTQWMTECKDGWPWFGNSCTFQDVDFSNKKQALAYLLCFCQWFLIWFLNNQIFVEEGAEERLATSWLK